MPRDDDDGTFDLAAELAAGNIEIHHPGTPEYEAHARAMADQLDDYNARLLAQEGPDALTSDRHLRQAAIAAERDPERVGYAFAAWCRIRGWERSDLADWLGVTADQLAAMALEQRSAERLAARFGADPGRLGTVLGA